MLHGKKWEISLHSDVGGNTPIVLIGNNFPLTQKDSHNDCLFCSYEELDSNVFQSGVSSK